MNQFDIFLNVSIVGTILYLIIPILESIIDLLGLLFVWIGKKIIKIGLTCYMSIITFSWIILLVMIIFDFTESFKRNGYDLNQVNLRNITNINIEKLFNNTKK
jgi:hypothetical protein